MLRYYWGWIFKGLQIIIFLYILSAIIFANNQIIWNQLTIK